MKEKHPDVVQSPIANDCLKIRIDGKKCNIPKLLLQISVSKLFTDFIKPESEGGCAEARDGNNKLIIGDSTFRAMLPPKLWKMSECHKMMCGCETCLSASNMHTSLLAYCIRMLEDLIK